MAICNYIGRTTPGLHQQFVLVSATV